MKRLYFLIPDIGSAKTIVGELLQASIEQRHIHIAAADHHALLKANLPEANLLQESDFVPAVERGIAIGGVTGVLAGIAAVAIPGAGFVLGGGAILGIGLAGAGLGAWISGMIGMSVPSSRLREFEHAIDRGSLLMMVDIARTKANEITELIRQHYPQVHVEGIVPVTHASR